MSETVVQMVKRAQTAAYRSFGSYEMNEKGLYRKLKEIDPATGKMKDKDRMWLAGPFEVVALVRNGEGEAWGKLLRWRDRDERQHEWPMPMAALGGSKEVIWQRLLDGGLSIATSTASRNRLADYLASALAEDRLSAVSRIGWHQEAAGAVYVLPDRTYAADEKVAMVWQPDGPATPPPFNVSGTAEQWCEHIGQRCCNNSRLVLAVSTAFAAPLLYVANAEGGGIHFVGTSQIGKSTTGEVSASVWGGGGASIKGYVESWRNTVNGLEGIGASHCDALLVLDEIGEIDARDIGPAAYMLANGQGKGRANKTGLARPRVQWRLLFVSSGESTLRDKLAEIGQRSRGGQEVRLLNIPADAGGGHGLFEVLHGAPNGEIFANQLRRAVKRYYGAPIRRYLELLTGQFGNDLSLLADWLDKHRAEFVAGLELKDAAAQVRSVAARFGLIAAAGEMASALKLTGWPKGEADHGCRVCFQAWLDDRGSLGDHDVELGIQRVVAFLEAHGASRFEAAWETRTAPMGGSAVPLSERIVDRAGFRRRINGDWHYYILPEAWTSVVLPALPARQVAAEMVKRGLLLPDNSGKPSQFTRVPGHAKPLRLYRLSPDLLSEGLSSSDDE